MGPLPRLARTPGGRLRRRRALVAGCLALVAALAAAAPGRAAPYAPGEVIVKERAPSSAERLALFERTGVERTLARVGVAGARLVAVEGDPAAVAARLRRSAHVEWAEPNWILHTTATPNDPRLGELWGLHNDGSGGGLADADIDAPEGWDALPAFPATGGAPVGIVDTGIDLAHPDLEGKVAPADCAEARTPPGLPPTPVRVGTCADDHGHGTHVAATVAARANDGVGVAGVAFSSPLVVCRALGGPFGSGTVADVASCIGWTAARGARVISLSLGGPDSATLRAAVEAAWRGGAGALVVAAAGNSGDATVFYPAGYPEVVSVAATDRADERAEFSTANDDVEVAAPGVDILSAEPGGGYVVRSGTSMATPHVAGVAAVIATLNPTLDAAGVRARLQAAVDDLGPAGRDPSFGFGRVNLCKAAGRACAYAPGG